jgi:hypothetical protein
MPLPDYIDNSHHTLQAVLDTIIKDERQLTLDIATRVLQRFSKNSAISLEILIQR